MELNSCSCPEYPVICPKDRLTLVPELIRTTHLQHNPRTSIHEQTWRYPCPLCGYHYEHYIDIYDDMESRIKRLEWARQDVDAAEQHLQRCFRDVMEF